MIRRELPLTVIASPVEPVGIGQGGFSFVLAQTAAGSALEMSNAVHGFCFFLLRKVFVFALVCFMLRFAGLRSPLLWFQ
jgi:hypothetical protein